MKDLGRWVDAPSYYACLIRDMTDKQRCDLCDILGINTITMILDNNLKPIYDNSYRHTIGYEQKGRIFIIRDENKKEINPRDIDKALEIMRK